MQFFFNNNNKLRKIACLSVAGLPLLASCASPRTDSIKTGRISHPANLSLQDDTETIEHKSTKNDDSVVGEPIQLTQALESDHNPVSTLNEPENSQASTRPITLDKHKSKVKRFKKYNPDLSIHDGREFQTYQAFKKHKPKSPNTQPIVLALNSGTPAEDDIDHTELIDNEPELQSTEIEEPKARRSKNTRLSLSNLIDTTLKTNPELIISNAQMEDARLNIDVERTGLTPDIDFTVSTGLENTATSTSSTDGIHRTELGLTYKQNLFDFGATSSAIKRREFLYQSAQLRKADAAEQVSFNVLKSYFNYLRQVDLVASANRNIVAHENISKLVKLNQEGGNATVADVKKVKTRLDAAKSQQVTNENALKDAIAAFRRLTKLEPSSIIRPRHLAPRLPKISAKNLASHIARNPKLRAFAADRSSLQQQLKQQNASLFPNLSAQGEANYKSNVSGDTGESRNLKGMIVLSFKLFDGGKRKKIAEQIDQRVLEADGRHQKLFRELRQNFEQSQQVLNTTKKKASFLQGGVEAAKKVIDLYTKQFQAGTRSPFELLDAQKDLQRSEQELINHRFDSALAGYQLLRLRGDLVRYLTK